jgi:hypothetical protein
LPGQKLKPENVCWDVTSGVDSHAPDVVPLVYMTGYKVTYAPGGSAVPFIKPHPLFGAEPLIWYRWWHTEAPGPPGIAVFYKANNAKFINLDATSNPNASIPNFVPTDFDPKGKTYRQLTPDGPLPGN